MFKCLASKEIPDNVLALFTKATFKPNAHLWFGGIILLNYMTVEEILFDKRLFLVVWVVLINCIVLEDLPLVQTRFGAGVDWAKVKIRE